MNGAGKTTIIKILSTILSLDEGSIKVDKLDLIKDEYKVKQKINLITSGDRGLYWSLTARDNLDYFASLYGIPNKERKKVIDNLLNFVGLEERADELVEIYSKGMKQRLQIARGLINDPDYILLDEPTVGLDINISKIMRNKIKELAYEKNKGILLTTHYINEVEELCDYIYIIDNGYNIYEGKVSDIIDTIIKGNIKFFIDVSEFNYELEKEIERLYKEENLKIEHKFENNTNTLIVYTKENLKIDLIDHISKFTQILSFYSSKPSLEEVILTLIRRN